ncbi:polynucleotide adenylyltransferase [Nonomuraea turkmeniaca]|uniref:Polynucleotide adenylyltransferase n=1 Tax=Nonomuraea turkmeniaca TaxID=103838 RepID=A0A5S4EWE3_9ACTN|nr:poly(A) polymerase [Nonomuraea turkmeniaca]TMR07772.1 polynucleotide adenylyltransferase [Nonomuraea turkmeniaca]
MRTSEEIYHRVRWDPRFDPSRFVLGVGQRGAAPKRVPLPVFVPGGEIPWHRVLFVEADGELVWDRVTGLDRVDTCDAGRAREPRRLRAPFFTARTPHVWDPVAGWRPGSGEAAAGTTAVRVLTWNTLWDRYDSGHIDTARRRPLLVAALEEADADVIALQEVEPALLSMLLSAPWARARYTLGTDPEGEDVDDGGLLLLSRLPVREAAWHVLGPHKAVSAIVVDTADGPLTVAVTHLTSDHADDGQVRRREELAQIAEGLAGVGGDLILAGDFNDGTDAPASVLGFRDAWTEAYGPDQTPTFDPHANPLAALASLSGRAARLDRILLRGRPRVVSAALRGDTPTPEGLYISDHYGVEAVLDLSQVAEVLDARPSTRTAVAWVPPREMWPPIQDVRRKHDPQFYRWPPHVNLLFGFVPESDFESAAPLLAAAAAEIEPFAVRLEGVRTFRHRNDVTVWLDPAAGTGEWIRLRQALERRFPRCKGRAGGFTPHLTLGRAKDRQGFPVRLDGMTAQVGDLVVLSRRADEPMRPRAVITLGSGEVRWLDETAERSSETGAPVQAAETLQREAQAAGQVARRLAEALRPGIVHIVGSRRMGCELPAADLDLVAALPGEADMTEIEALVRAALPDAGRLRQVIGARVPGLRLCVADLDVDLTVVATGPIPPSQALVRRAELGQAAAIAMSAVSDADTIRAAVGAEHARFARLARQVKAWARARGLDSAPFGGLPGLAWTVLAARTARESGDLPADRLLGHFFSTWAAWNWRDPVTLTPAAVSADPAPMTVMTPSDPMRNCARQVSAGGVDLITQELYRAWELTETARFRELPAPPPLHRRHAAWAVLTVRSDRAEEFEAVLGRVRGRILELLGALERAGVPDAHAWPRPFETGASSARYAIGLGSTPLEAAQLAEITGRWGRGLSEITIERAECGAVPSLT